MKRTSQSHRVTQRLAVAIIVGMVVCFGLYVARRVMYGDSSAPVHIVPQAWVADCEIDGDRCSVLLTYDFEALKTDTSAASLIPLFPEGTVFGEITLNATPVVPVKHESWVCVEVPRAGTHRAQCRIDVRVSDRDGVYSCRLKKAPFIHSTVRIDSDAPWEVGVSGQPQLLVGTDSDGTRGSLPAGILQEVELTWRKPRPRARREGHVSITPSVVWTVREKTLSADVTLDMAIRSGTRDTVTLLVPEGAGRIEPAPGMVENWTLTGRELTLYFNRQIGGDVRIELSMEVARTQAARAVCPAIDSDQDHIATGGYLVIVDDAPGVLLESVLDGLEEVADIEVPVNVRGKVKGKPQFIYRVSHRGAEPEFDLVTRELFPMVDTIADRAEILTVIYDGGEEITRALYSIRNNNQQFLRMAMPPGCELLSLSVDNRRRMAAERHGVLLVPLEDSVQTLGGLIPFPVEVLYCRQGVSPAAGQRMTVDLPELPDVPVASFNVRIFHPDALTVEDYQSALSPAEAGATPATGLWPTAGHGSADHLADTWAYNAYWSGYRAYRENRLEDAETLLRQVSQATGDAGQLAELSHELLGNIRAGRGEVKGDSKFERAQISAIQGTLASMNDQIEVQQSQLIEVGLANIEQGDEELGAELLKQADVLGAQIGNRGGSTRRQVVVRKEYAGKLKAVEDERRRKRELEEKLKRLQGEAREMAQNSPHEAKRLGKGLASAAREEEFEQQDGLLALAWGKKDSNRQLSAGAQAKTVQKQVQAQAAPTLSMQREGKDLRSLNQDLEQQVSVLEKAVHYAKAEASEKDGQWARAERDYVTQALEKQKSLLAGVKNRIMGARRGRVAANEYYASRDELDEIKQQVQASQTSFEGADASIDNEMRDLAKQVAALETEVNAQGQTLQADDTIDVVTTNLFADASANTLQSFETFMNYNYNPSADEQPFVIAGDVMKVANAPDEAERISEVLQSFEDNAGNAVRFGVRKFSGVVTSSPAIQTWFTNTTVNGNAFAVLDEAQYNTLVFSQAEHAGDNAPAVLDEKDIIVGTPNRILGTEVTLSMADALSNGIRVDDTNIQLGHDRYLAVCDDSGVTVVKGGAARSWQDDADGLNLEIELPFRLEIPTRGQETCFNKTLLAAGETADITFIFER